ncbi:MAG: TIGR04222 domain-containing membrane protein [Gammaproteobacteria bacterium]|nr:TIGR04222 domain-containing membrane protein [Gammaproteobacteria bacterium]
MLTQIPGPFFLLIFTVFSVACIIGGRLWANADGSKEYPLPEMIRLNPYEIAALRAGRKGVIQTVLFLLWHRKLIKISGKGRTARIMKGEFRQPTANPLEEAVYNFVVRVKRKPGEFFNPSRRSLGLHSKIDELLGPVNQTLEELHLRCDKSEMKQAWIAFLVPLGLILGIGCTKIYFGIYYDRPVIFLILLLIVMAVISIKILKPRQTTQLGRRYQKKLVKNFLWMKSRLQNDPAFDVAVFGTTALAGIAFFSLFENASAMTAGRGTAGSGFGGGSGGGSGGGGDSSSDGGGGCGGCGGD